MPTVPPPNNWCSMPTVYLGMPHGCQLSGRWRTWCQYPIMTMTMIHHHPAPMTSVRRSSFLDWKKDWNQTEPNCKRPDHQLRLHKLWNFLVASCNICWEIEKPKKNRSRPVATGISSCYALDLTHTHFSLIVGFWIIKNGQELVEI